MSDRPQQNRLAHETSPYLLQHASNPVDWYPWGDEALGRARSEDRPILLSVGYAACHWCHVMEHESFEDADTAALMNEHFVCIKVDREERPDIDDVYMRAVQMMVGRGGWPMTVFLTPELEPFYGGTYFPPEPRMGMPSFRNVLLGVAEAWEKRRGEILDVGRQLAQQLQPRDAAAPEPVDRRDVYRAAMSLHEQFDPNHGGFGGAPKFPNATSLSLLLRFGWREQEPTAIEEAEFSLQQVADGGIRDHVGGGFHRYAVDARWLVPHFEKMLYDNALLATAYLEAFQVTGAPAHAETVRSVFDWVLREMVTAEGGFAATIDADSEGVEGKFYVWSLDQVEKILGEEASAFAAAYDVTAAGNWEGQVILHRPRPLDRVAAELGLEVAELEGRLEAGRAALLEARATRVRPGLDDKVLADWNGLMISALTHGYRVLGETAWLEAAQNAARFVLGPMSEGGLRHAWRADRAGAPGFLDDWAAMLQASLDLFRSTYAPEWLESARELADGLLERFDDGQGAFFFTSREHDELVARPRSAHDGATPSGNGMAVRALAMLGHLTQDDRYLRAARSVPAAFASQIRRHPSGFSTLLLGVDELAGTRREIVVVGPRDHEATTAALRALWARYAPDQVVLLRDPGDPALERLERLCPTVKDKDLLPDAIPTFYDCRDRTCQAPTGNVQEILDA